MILFHIFIMLMAAAAIIFGWLAYRWKENNRLSRQFLYGVTAGIGICIVKAILFTWIVGHFLSL